MAVAGVVDVVGQPPATAGAVPLAAPGCGSSTAIPAADDPGALPARISVRYRPDPAAGTGTGTGAAGPVGVAAVVESVGHGVSYDVGPCQSMAATLYGSLPDGTTVHGSVSPGRRSVRGDAGGQVLLVDSATGARALHGGREGFEGFSGWYGVVADAVPGTYSWSSDVVWSAAPGSAAAPVGRGRLVLTLVLGGAPHVPGGR